MKIYNKQYYSLGQRLHKSFRGMIQERGYLAPQFSTFSGYSKANPCKIFNICILDKDIEYDGSFVHAFLQYHNECLEERICSLVFFHPANKALAMFIGKQIQTITTQYINSADLSEEFVIEWLGNHYMKGKLPNRLDYVLNRPFINLKVIRCPMCGCKMKVPAGIMFGSMNKPKLMQAPTFIEHFLPVTKFTDNIGGGVYLTQRLVQMFSLYDDDEQEYATPQYCTCKDCSTQISLDTDNLDSISYGPGVYFSIPPFHLTDNDIRVVRQSGYPEEPGTGESIDIDI